MVQCLVQGILLGGLYAIIGIGMSLVFGIMRLTNLAHGDLMITSAYITMYLCKSLGQPLLISFGISALILVAIGFVVQSQLINRVLDKGAEPALLVTFGVSIFLANLLLQVFGADYRNIPNNLSTHIIVSSGVISISGIYLFNFIAGVLLITVLHFIMQKTNFGRSIRATADDKMASELMGVNTKRAYSMAMMLAMLTAAIAGALLGSTFTFNPASGTSYLIIAFGVVVIGGMGSMIGTLLGGVVLGVSQLLGSYFFGSGVQLLAAFIVLLVILAIRPSGLLSQAGRK